MKENEKIWKKTTKGRKKKKKKNVYSLQHNNIKNLFYSHSSAGNKTVSLLQLNNTLCAVDKSIMNTNKPSDPWFS